MTESRVREERRVPPERTSAQATRGGGPPAGGEDRRLEGRLRSSPSHPTRQDLAQSRFSLAFPFSQQIVPCSPSLHPRRPAAPPLSVCRADTASGLRLQVAVLPFPLPAPSSAQPKPSPPERDPSSLVMFLTHIFHPFRSPRIPRPDGVSGRQFSLCLSDIICYAIPDCCERLCSQPFGSYPLCVTLFRVLCKLPSRSVSVYPAVRVCCSQRLSPPSPPAPHRPSHFPGASKMLPLLPSPPTPKGVSVGRCPCP